MLNIPGHASSVSRSEIPAVRLHADTAIPQAIPKIPKLNQLAKQSLISQKSFKAKTLNTSYKWQLAKMQALFQTIYSEGVTERDEEQLNLLEHNLKELEANVGHLKTSKRERVHAFSLISQAQEMIAETRILIKRMSEYQLATEKFNQAIDSLVDLSYSPEDGNPLLASESLKEVADGLGYLLQTVPLDEKPEGLVQEKLLLLFKQDFTHLSWIIEDWVEVTQKQAKLELTDLSKTAETKEQGEAFIRHLAKMQKNIEASIATLQELGRPLPSKELEHLLKNCVRSLKEGKDSLALMEEEGRYTLKKRNSSSEAMEYGDETWNSFSKRFPSKQPSSGIYAKMKHLTDSENWSSKTKDVVYRVFAAMQLGQQIQGVFTELSRAGEMKQMANRLQEEALRTLPKGELANIEKETSVLGTLLSDKYLVLQEEHVLEKLTSKYPEMQASLKSIIKEYGKQPPSREDIPSLMDAYKIQRLLSGGAGSPFSHLSIGEWWNRFVFGKEEAEPFTASLDALT